MHTVQITVTDADGVDVSLTIVKSGAATATIEIGGNGSKAPYKLFDIRQTDEDGFLCRAEAPGRDPDVEVDVDGKHVIVNVTGTTFGLADQNLVCSIGPANRQKLIDFLKLAAFPK